MVTEGTVHRAGSLKQVNKSHKHGKHKSNRELDNQNKGKKRKFIIDKISNSKMLF